MDSTARIQAVRSFNRFYTKEIGVLQPTWLGSDLSLPETRVLYELAHHEEPTATDIVKELGLDAGYLSRMLRALSQRGFVRRTRSKADGRQAQLTLSSKGRAIFKRLNQETQDEVAAMLQKLSAADQRRLVASMRVIEEVLGAKRESPTSYVLRPPQPGDLGWIVHRQGAVYAEEWGYNEEFEALCADIVAAFVKHLRPAQERCWIAEKDGEIAGMVMLVRKTNTVAKLRLLFVEPWARGLGMGGRLIDECVRFAKQAGYRKMVLWTQSELLAARRLYKKAGFKVIAKQPHDSFGRKGLVAETWEIEL